MENKRKAFGRRWTAFLTVLAICAVFAFPARAEEPATAPVPFALRDTVYAGVEAGGKYAISTPEDWLALIAYSKNGADVAGMEFHLTADIDMENTAMDPVSKGEDGKVFSCLLDGHGHVFKNVRISGTLTADTAGVGLIGKASNCTIRDLGVESGTVTLSGLGGVGAILGFSDSCTLYRCWNGANVVKTAGGGKSGALVGRTAGGGNVTIDQCYNIGNLSANSHGAAMCGWDRVNVYNCFNAGSITVESGWKMLAAIDYSDVANFWDVSGSDFPIKNSGTETNSGKLTAEAYSNGLLAWTLNTNYTEGKGERPYYTLRNGRTVFGTAENQTRRVTVTRSGAADTFLYLNAGSTYDLDIGTDAEYTVTAGSAEINGSVLTVPASDITVSVREIVSNASTVRTVRKRLSALDPALFTDPERIPALIAAADALLESGEPGDAETAAFAAEVEAIGALLKNTYPYLVPYALRDTLYNGMDAAGKYAIGCKEDWLAVTKTEGNFAGVELHFTADADMENTPMAPIGVSAYFAGTVDGHGHVLRNVSITRNGEGPAALAAQLSGSIRDLGIESGAITANQNGTNDHNGAAAFAGHLAGSLFRCWNGADITVNVLPGGNAATFASGIAARRSSIGAKIDNCYNIGTVSGGTRVTGLCGWVCSITVSNSFNAGKLIGSGTYLAFVSNQETPDLKNIAEVSGQAMYLTDRAYYAENDNVVFRMDPADYANGKLAWTLNHSYVEGVGEQPFYTVKDGKTVFGTPEEVPYRITFMIGRAEYAERYTDLAGALIEPAPASIPARTLRGWKNVAGETVDPAAAVFTGDTALYAVADAADTVSVSLKDSFQMNLKLDPDFYERDVLKITVTGPDVTGAEPIQKEIVPGGDTDPAADGRYWIFWPVAAAQIADPFTFAVTYADGQTEQILSGYSVNDYLIAAGASDPGNEALAALCRATRQYGACAQKAFDYHAESLAAAIETELDPDLLNDARYDNKVTGTREAVGLARVTASAVIRDRVALRVYIKLAEGAAIGDYTLSVTKNGFLSSVSPQETGTEGEYLLEIADITARDFCKAYTFSVWKGGTGYSLVTGVLHYGKTLLKSTGVSNEMKRLICAMKAYSEAAAYFAEAYAEIDYSGYIKVASFNVERLQEDRALLIEQIKRIDPDIIGLQELDRFTSRNNEDQIAILAEACGYQYYGYDRTIAYSNGGGYGVGVISRYPILSHTTVNYEVISPTDGDGNRAYGRYELDVGGRTLCFYNTHLTLGNTEINGAELRQLTTAMEADEYAVATGDFNMQAQYFPQYMNTEKLKFLNGGDDLAMLKTFPAGEESSTPIDNIICTRGMKHYWDPETNAAIIVERSYASDHNMIYTYISFPDA